MGGFFTKPIDFHAHIYTDEMAPKAIASVKRRMGVRVPGLGTVADLQDSMAKAGVERSIILPLAPLPKHVAPTNDFFLAAAGNGEGLIAFGAIHPFQPDLEEELDRLIEVGVKGVKAVPFMQRFYPDDPRCDRLYGAVEERGMILLLHAGKVPEDLPEFFGTPDRFARMVERHPDLVVVLAHLGGWEMWSGVREHLIPAGENVYFDTAYISPSLTSAEACDLICEIGADRVLFGTDYPWTDQTEEIEFVGEMDLSDREKRLILSENARKLLFR
ncbi:MAG TPA: amidohydrolase family protein [Methanothrix sp.]|nr:amidohydrolase family protein [Methanothrix sp.]HRW83161.1 amidohydrolase family protein [Methanothrix sp.]